MSSSKSQSSFGIRKLPARYAGTVMPLLLSILMTFVVSMISTLRSVGWGDNFLKVWPSAWALTAGFGSCTTRGGLVASLTSAIDAHRLNVAVRECRL